MLNHYRRISLIVWLILSVAAAAAIFLFSSQTGPISGEVSRGVLRKILELFFGSSSDELIRQYNYPLRKAAHFTLFAILGFSLIGVFQHQKRMPKLAATTLLSTAFAALDEFHQHFVKGRSPLLSDVLLDVCGAAAGALLMCAILFLIHHVREHRRPEERKTG